MDVLMPQLGETVAEGKITQWFKSPGEAVKPGDRLFEIETDKTSMEVEAVAAGVLAEIRAGVGEVVPVGGVVAVIAEAAGVRTATAAPASPPRPRVESRPRPASGRRSRRLPPAVPSRLRSIPSSRCARPPATTARPGAAPSP